MVLHTLSILGALYSSVAYFTAGGTLDEAIDPDGAAAGCRFPGWLLSLLFTGHLPAGQATGGVWFAGSVPLSVWYLGRAYRVDGVDCRGVGPMMALGSGTRHPVITTP